MLNINKMIKDESAVFKLEGKIDTITSRDLAKEINSVLDSLSLLLLDFDKVEYISSAGIRVLVAAKKSMSNRGEVKVTNVKDNVKDIFDVTGLSVILGIE